jgi:NADH:ubiquinone oxidoreductase subunit F (NADH-binding)
MAAPDVSTPAPPTLVNNVETLAHAACILADGPSWFREVGTSESPGTTVCTVSGDTRRHGVAELAMGTPVRDVIDSIGGGARRGREIAAVMTGVSNPLLDAARHDAPMSYEGTDAAGSGLGTAGFIVFDDEADMAAVAHGVFRFLAIESCGQCTPCKQDGLAHEIEDHTRTVADEARCSLAHQHQRVASSILALFPEAFRAHVQGDSRRGGREVLKRPDWTFNETDSGRLPVERIDQRSEAG